MKSASLILFSILFFSFGAGAAEAPGVADYQTYSTLNNNNGATNSFNNQPLPLNYSSTPSSSADAASNIVQEQPPAGVSTATPVSVEGAAVDPTAASANPAGLFGFNVGEQATDLTTKCLKNAEADKASGEGYTVLTAEAKAISAAYEACATNANLAQKACLESLNPNIGKAAGILGGMASMAAGSRSTADMCKNNGGMLDMAKTAMMAYNTACAGAKATCDMMTCPKVATVVEAQLKIAEGKEKINCPEGIDEAPNCPAYVADLTKLKTYSALAQKGGTCFKTGCDKYGAQLASALGSIAQMAAQSQASKNCEKAVTNAPAQPLDCSKPENASNSTCICQANPRQAGCPGTSSASTGEANKAIGSGLKNGTSSLNGIPSIPYSDLASQQPSGSGADSASGGGGGGGSGGGGGRGGLGSGSGGLGANGSAGKVAPNTNIYGGDSGGGGGGRSAGAGYSDKLAKMAASPEQLRKLASGGVGEISGKSGKSNWQKIKDSYAENRAKLINN